MEVLHSKILGEGQPFLILHGYFGMSDNWKTLGNQFAKDYQVHLLDQRNHGRSFHAREFNYEVMADDLLTYIEHHELSNCILLGHSMGGKTAMLFAVEHPDLIDKLIIADIAPRAYRPHHNEILAALNSVDFTKHNSRKLIDEQLQSLIPIAGVRQFLMKNVYWREKGVLDFRFNLASLTENNPEVGKPLPPNTHFEKETLFLAGGSSGYITSEEVPLIKHHFPQAMIHTMKNAGHWLHAERPQEFYNEVMKFLG
ncbi:MAG: alpha/beta hydrolase [Flavobacteriaceae bacterium]|nr:alpha/beta hydrolase [Flavobacteriaceae bacterium]|tara:strand:- start:36412 stop:37176 length:765 start_codon:yes stop_codon:yes gene_type:complete